MLSPTTFLREVRQEINKVTWPDRTQTQKMTLIVIGVSLVLGAYIGLLDSIFQRVMEYYIL